MSLKRSITPLHAPWVLQPMSKPGRPHLYYNAFHDENMNENERKVLIIP